MRILLLISLGVLIAASCASQQNEPVYLEPGAYVATISEDRDETTRAYSAASMIVFTFEAGQRFIYSVRAMGRDIDDVGQYEMRGDSLYIFGLERGPDTAFKLNALGDNQYEIIGPNHFILTRKDP